MPLSGPSGSATRQTLSGPHVCSHVGTQLLTIAKAALADACRSKGGSITAAEIDAILDLIAARPEIFSLYTGQYSACAGIHHAGKFTQIDAPTFARFILRSFCLDIVKDCFRGQIGRAGSAWTRPFLEGLIQHVEGHAVAGFSDRLYERYRVLALTKGRALGSSTFHSDHGIHTILRDAFHAIFAEDDEHEALTDHVNGSIGKALHLAGPSPLKVTNADIAAFLSSLRKNRAGSHFRKAVLTGHGMQGAHAAQSAGGEAT